MHIDGKAFQDKSEESSACSVYLFHKLHVLLYLEKAMAFNVKAAKDLQTTSFMEVKYLLK